MKIISALILLSLHANFTVGQSRNLVDLLRELPQTKSDTSTAKVLLEISEKYLMLDVDSALYFNKRCEALVLEKHLDTYAHRCYHHFVKIYHAQREFQRALEYCLKSIQVAQENNNRFQEATSYRALFNLYHNLKMNDSAVKYAVYSIRLTREIGDTANIAANYGNLSWLYMDLNQYDKAIEYGLKGIESGVRYVDTVGLLIAINNTALCYLRTNKNLEAIDLLKRQYEIGKRVKRQRSIRYALVNLGVAYYNLGNASGLAESTKLLNQYLDSDPSVSGQLKCLQCINNAYNFALHKKFREAEEELFKGIQIARVDSLTDLVMSAYSLMSRLKFAQHDFPAGNYYDLKWDSISEKQDEMRLAEYAAELETKYETENKTEQIKLQDDKLRQRLIANYMLGGAGVSLLIISLLTYRTFKQKQKLQQQRISELETEKQLSATEAVLKGEEQERTRLAKDLHDGLGGMLSGIRYSFSTMKENIIMTPENHQAFERSMDMLDSSIKEMRRVAHNMMPESLIRFGLDAALKDFCSDITQSGALSITYQSMNLDRLKVSQTVSITIYRIVQELINNVIKHAKARNAIVQITMAGEKLDVTVEDDGVGFDTAILERSKGAGWSNIQSRVEFLRGTLEVRSDKTNGTSVHLDVKL